jgi:hypothetical protein
MGRTIRRVVMSVALSLPLVTAIGARQIPRGQDGRVPSAASAGTPVKVGESQPRGGTPCRRSAADPLDAAPPARHGSGPAAPGGCNLRLLRRQPADAPIWV